jgi:hypothetical protein
MSTVESPRQETTQMNVELPIALYDQIKARAKAEDRTIAGIVRNALRMFLAYEGQRD